MTTPAASDLFCKSAISAYLNEIDNLYRAGNATEHSYRPALKSLFEKLTQGTSVPELTITNEPKHIACGAPDYIITKGDIPLGYIEAKDISVGIDNKLNKEQFDRYRRSLNNLIITDYLTFRLFVDGEPVVTVSIANVSGSGITPDKTQFSAFLELINRFTMYSGKTIYHSELLAVMMANKAKLLARVLYEALINSNAEDDSLSGQLEGFRKILIHDLSEAEFADMYAQTLAYGLFAARLNQNTNEPFSRIAAAQLIPQSNPFLRKFFQYIAGFDLDTRICWIVDALAGLFNRVSVDDIKKEFEKANQDPYIHFYETFLMEYNPRLREGRGVFYTPLPAVQFIVHAIDDILQKDFDLSGGLADHAKIKKEITRPDGSKKTIEFHRVQILDPATGTGTFLAEVIENIHRKYANQPGMWKDYCGEHLIPRLNGFEILMASYAMAHFKMNMTLQETGYTVDPNSRLHIFLTNTLEEAPEKAGELFMAQWLTREAEEAGRVKRDVPVMVVMGNPPYNVSTQNKNEWIDGLIADYKKNLSEKKLNLDDDYIKFIRYGQYLIEKNGIGVLAYISNSSFIDGLTHRTMRKILLEQFDKIYILDLHGNSNRKEKAPDGSIDENVFDIQQGVSINIFIKNGKKDKGGIARIYHNDLYGKRETKYHFLAETPLADIKWTELFPGEPYFFFVPKNFSNQSEYDRGFRIPDLFPVFSSGVESQKDTASIRFRSNECEKLKADFINLPTDAIYTKYHFEDGRDWKIADAKYDMMHNSIVAETILYRPLDFRSINYTGKSGIIAYPRYNTMRHLLAGENIALISTRQCKNDFGVFVTKYIAGHKSCVSYDTNSVFPLYLYPDENSLDKNEQRRPNLNMDIVNAIAEKINGNFTTEKQDDTGAFAPVDILDYIYAVLYSSAYRQKYMEFLKIDFPRVPYPQNPEQFYKLSAIGSLLRNVHLMETVTPDTDLATFPVEGSNSIEALQYKDERVYINKTQYFENIPAEIWAYYIGGYQPAQKWLKDRKNRALDFSEKEHYQKIIAAIKTTIDLQRQIDTAVQNV